MPAIITNKFRLNNAEQFQESFSETAATVYYLGIGRAQNFGTITRPDARTDYEGTETAPSTPGDSVLNEFKNFDDLLAAKKITGSDVSFCIPRRNWTTGTTYDIYRHDYEEYVTGSTSTKVTANSTATTLFDSTFYVLTGFHGLHVFIGVVLLLALWGIGQRQKGLTLEGGMNLEFVALYWHFVDIVWIVLFTVVYLI